MVLDGRAHEGSTGSESAIRRQWTRSLDTAVGTLDCQSVVQYRTYWAAEVPPAPLGAVRTYGSPTSSRSTTCDRPTVGSPRFAATCPLGETRWTGAPPRDPPA